MITYKRRLHTRDTLYLIREYARDGYTQQETADELGLTLGQVRYISRTYEIWFQHGRPDPFIRSTILSLVNQCGNAKEVAKIIGRSPELVQRWIRQLEKQGLIIRTGRTRGTKLVVSRRWTI